MRMQRLPLMMPPGDEFAPVWRLTYTAGDKNKHKYGVLMCRLWVEFARTSKCFWRAIWVIERGASCVECGWGESPFIRVWCESD